MKILFAFKENMSPVLKGLFPNDTCRFTHNGDSTIKAVRNFKPDLLVLDLVLPKLDGFSVLDYINENLTTKPLIIIASNLIQDAVVAKAVKAGASYYLARPFKPHILKKHIDMLFEYAQSNYSTLSSEELSIISTQSSKLLFGLGITSNINGFVYLKEAVKEIFINPSYRNSITRKIYPLIAKQNNTTPYNVERGIRHAIKRASKKGKIKNMNKLFDLNIEDFSKLPTNSELITLIVDKVQSILLEEKAKEEAK